MRKVLHVDEGRVRRLVQAPSSSSLYGRRRPHALADLPLSSVYLQPAIQTYAWHTTCEADSLHTFVKT